MQIVDIKTRPNLVSVCGWTFQGNDKVTFPAPQPYVRSLNKSVGNRVVRQVKSIYMHTTSGRHLCSGIHQVVSPRGNRRFTSREEFPIPSMHLAIMMAGTVGVPSV